MEIVCLDLEGVLVPEIWIAVAERTGIAELRLTTKDVADYDVLMRRRLAILDDRGLGIADLQDVIAGMGPLPGAAAFLARLRARYQVVILSDTFYEFAAPLMRQLDSPTLFCHRLDIDARGRIAGYRLRMANHKKAAVDAFRSLKFRTLAAGDSYNDTAMLLAADLGLLFCPPDNVVKEFPTLPVARDYEALYEAFQRESANANTP